MKIRKFTPQLILVLFTVLIIEVHSQEFEILNRKYKCIYNESISLQKPKIIQYKNNQIIFILENRQRYEMKNFQDKPKKGLKEMSNPQNIMQYTDAKGVSYELMKGEIRSTNRRIITTRDGYKTFQMIPDRERACIYFIAKKDSHPAGQGTLFAMDTSRVSGAMATSEIEFLGNYVFALGIEPVSGNLAVGSKQPRGWILTVLQESGKTLVQPAIVKPTTSPTITASTEVTKEKFIMPTTTSTESTVIVKPKLPNVGDRFNDLVLEEILTVSKDSIGALFNDNMQDCLSLQRRVDSVLKNFRKTLDLTEAEMALIRKDNLPSLISTSSYDTIASEIESIFANILDEYKKNIKS